MLIISSFQTNIESRIVKEMYAFISRRIRQFYTVNMDHDAHETSYCTIRDLKHAHP